VVEEGFDVFDDGIVRGTVTGVVVAEVTTSPTPKRANGFGLPIVASGVSTILESCKLTKAGSEKMESSNFMVLTLNKSVRKFPATAEVPAKLFTSVPEPEAVVVLEDDTKLA